MIHRIEFVCCCCLVLAKLLHAECLTGSCPLLGPCKDCAGNVDCAGMRCSDQSEHCVSSQELCDGKAHCDNCNDERCPHSPFFYCEDGNGCINLFESNSNNFTFCDGTSNCADGSDERKSGFGFKCASQSGSSACIVPQEYLERFANNSKIELCRNKSNQCFKIVNGTKFFNSSKCWSCLEGSIIQRQQVCDGIFDCPDLSDECLCDRDAFDNICKGLFSNQNCLSNQVSCPDDGTCLNVSQICDGNLDCNNKFDENKCNKSVECEKNFRCSNSRLAGDDLATKCDGFIECTEAEDECTEECGDIPWYCNHTNPLKMIALKDVCNISFNQVCDKIVDCPGSEDEIHCPHLKRCDENDPRSKLYNDQKCGEKAERCNLQASCPNIADELDCSQETHFYCDMNKTFLPQSHRFNGKYDCGDLTDECTFEDTSVSSSKEIIKLLPLRVFLWILMFLSLSGNTVVLTKTSFELRYALRRRLNSSMNRVDICNKIMILNLAFSDLLLGIYLMAIAVKTIAFSGNYCSNQLKWLQSTECTILGVVAVISSQTSVFLMVLMTSYRLYGVTKPFRANKIRNRIIYVAITVIWGFSFLIALVPTIPRFKVLFHSKLYVDQPYGPGFLLSLRNLENLFKMANRLPGLRNSFPTPSSLTLETFCTLFKYSRSKPSFCGLEQRSLSDATGYYGSDGVCLPRYYVSSSEPASAYTLIIIGFNFTAFLFMLIAYLCVYRITSADLPSGDPQWPQIDETRIQENKALWSKIVRLIATNFLCWVPIALMTFMSFNGIYLPSIVYPITATILVPINSAANPWIYSSFLINYVKIQWDLLRLKKKRTSGPGNRRRMQTRRRASEPFPSLELIPVFHSSVGNTTNDVTVATDL